MIKKIRHFEIVGDMEEFKHEWFNQDQGPIRKVSYEKLIRTYILPHLGRELKKDETRGVPCARIYYDEKGKMAGIRIYYREDLLCSYEFYLEPHGERGKVIKEEIKKEETGETGKIPNETTFIIERFDVKSDSARATGNLFEIKEKQLILSQNRVRIFSKIPSSPYDLHILEPTNNFFEIAFLCKPEYVLYKSGYKLIDDSYIDIDGMTVQKIRMIYDIDTLLKREELFIETPWGEFISRRITEWYYDIANHLISYKKFPYSKTEDPEVPGYSIVHYELDAKNHLSQYRSYTRSDDDSEEIIDLHAPEGMTLDWKIYYKCDDLGRVIEYQVENLDGVSHLFIALRKKLEYDRKGRIFRIKAYNEKDRIVATTTYEYPNEKQVRINCWCDRNNDVPIVEFLNATSRCEKLKETTCL